MSNHHLLLLDASGAIHKAFHALPAQYRDDGLPIWAILGFMSITWAMLQRVRRDDMPTHAAAVFDPPGKNWRHDIFPAYKSSRPAARRIELDPQLPYIRHAANAMGMSALEANRYEADDVLATLAERAAAKGMRVTIVSGDKDLMQLVRDGVIELIEPTNRRRYLAADVQRKFGVPPDLVPDAQALSGDSADDFPGLEGIGIKKAGELIKQFKGLEPLLRAAGQSGRSIGTPGDRKVLRRDGHKAILFKRLATLVTDVPNLPDPMELVLHKPDMGHLKEMLRVIGQERRYGIMFGGDPSVTMRLPHVPAPLAWWHEAVKNAAINLAWEDVPSDPQDGFYQRRTEKGGTWKPCRIWRDREMDFVTEKETGFDVVKCEVDGKPGHPLRHWDAIARQPITKAEYDRLVKGTAQPLKAGTIKSTPNPRLQRKDHV